MTGIEVDDLYSQFNAGYEQLVSEVEEKGWPLPEDPEHYFRLCLYNGDIAITATLGADGPHHIDIMTRAENMDRAGIQQLFHIYSNQIAFEKGDYVRDPSLSLFARNLDATDERFYIGQDSPQLKHHMEQVRVAWQGHEDDAPYGMTAGTATAFTTALEVIEVDSADLENRPRHERWGAQYNLQRGTLKNITHFLDAQDGVVSVAPDLYSEVHGQDVQGTSSLHLVQTVGRRGIHIALERPREDENQVVDRKNFERALGELEQLGVDLSGEWEVTTGMEHHAFNKEIGRYFERGYLLKEKGAV